MKTHALQFVRSIWFFPVILIVPLLVLTAFQISGSSVGVFRSTLYGGAQDREVILNHPRPIRSDEWLVLTQLTIAQSKAGFPEVNPNIGHGEDVSTVDVPYKDWSTFFKPQNWSFFVMPLDNAFALKWWLMAYLLLVSCYFFVLSILPGRRLIASILSVALLFSAFVQWWYIYGTLGSLYYSLFLMTLIVMLFRQRVLWKKIVIGSAMAYLSACFILVLYPPFQISCGLVVAAFSIGYFLSNFRSWTKQSIIHSLAILGASVVVALAVAGAFALTRADMVSTITHTAYPGTRVLPSGGFFARHFMSSHLGFQFTSDRFAPNYLIDGISPVNQSEASNFLLLLPFLVLPSAWIIYRKKIRDKHIDWVLVALNVMFFIFLLEMFAPAFTPFSKLLLFDKVGNHRLLIGVGLLNIVLLVQIIRNLLDSKVFSRRSVLIYSAAVLVVELWISLYTHAHFPLFIGLKRAILFSLPIPLIIYLLLRKRILLAVMVYALFSVFISFRVNPLYRGLGAVTDNPLVSTIRHLGKSSDKGWVSDGGYLENIASVAGERSLSGVYLYPQKDIWSSLSNVNERVYNRYAHVGFQLTDTQTPTQLSLATQDSFVVKTDTCGEFLRKQNIGYVVSASILENSCVTKLKTFNFPQLTLYIYKLR